MEVAGGAPEQPRPRSRRPPFRLRAAYKQFVLLLTKVSTGLRILSLPPHKLNVDQDEDRISALPDDLLLGILERLDLREAVRAGALSTRWRHLPHRLSRLHLDVRHFRGATRVEIMEAFTGALLSVCPLAERNCHCQRTRAIKTLRLRFYLSAPHLSSIGQAVEDVVSRGETDRLHFYMHFPYMNNNDREQFMSFSHAWPVAFRWLTMLTLENLEFGDSDVTDLICSCNRLKRLDLIHCTMVEYSALKIDTPCSGLQVLKFIAVGCTWIELVSIPKLIQVKCQSWHWDNSPVRFGYVPELRYVSLDSHAIEWQAPFALSECLSRSATNLSILTLNLNGRMIWIKPEHPKQLTAMLSNLTDVELFFIFPECDLSWTLFILEAAPALQNFSLSRERHSCVKTYEDGAKTNVVWEPSKDLKHLNLKLLQMSGFEEEDKVTSYIRLVMERAVGLKRIKLRGENSCNKCDAIDPRTSQVDEARRRRIKERLTHGSSSSVEIIMR